MNPVYQRFLDLPEKERKDAFEATASTLDSQGRFVEKDFWVCATLSVLYHERPDDHPGLLFKGGTSLSKAFDLINRFSEDIDIVVDRSDLGFKDEGDPTAADLSNKRRKALFEELRKQCSGYILNDLRKLLIERMQDCEIKPDPTDAEKQTLLIEYSAVYQSQTGDYVRPSVKLEGGARSALHPQQHADVSPYVSSVLPTDEWQLAVDVTTADPRRTYLEKLLILHGCHCGYRDEQRLPADKDRISRHYYDVAMITSHDIGQEALSDLDLLHNVREHNMTAFRSAWKKFDTAKPGSLMVVPSEELQEVIRRDYEKMQGMIYGNAPSFDWVMEQLEAAEAKINNS